MRAVGIRATLLALLVSFGGAAFGQEAWEKPIAPGLVYREEVNPAIPRIVHALRFSLRSPAVKAVPELAHGRVYDGSPSKGRGLVSDMVKANTALAGVNGDFFPWTGDPLGIMVREGRLISNAADLRAAMGWGPDDGVAAIADFDAVASNDAGLRLKIDGINRACSPNEVVLNTPTAGLSLSSEPTAALVLRPESTVLSPTGTVECKVEYLMPDVAKAEVKPATWLLVASGNRLDDLAKFRRGQTVKVAVRSRGFDWDKVENVIGGGPVLVRSGKVAVDWEAEGFDSAFSLKRHPRTAIGVTDAGDLWLVAVDGRQETSDGMTLEELANLMVSLGCREAVNLDGGGSTTLNVLGATLNRPSDGKERPVSNGVLLYGPSPLPNTRKLTIRLDGPLSVGQPVGASVIDGQGEEIPNADVLWAATGDAWIDQGGTLRSLKAGKVHIVAAVGRQLLSLDTPVSAAKPKAVAEAAVQSSAKPTRRSKSVKSKTGKRATRAKHQAP